MVQAVYYHEKRRRQRGKIKIFFFIFLFLVLAGGLFYLVVFSPVFKVKKIKIEGDFNQQELISKLEQFIAENSKISQLLGVENILFWYGDLTPLAKNYPVIKEIILKKSLFKQEITIKINERDKFGTWCAGPAAAPASSTSEIIPTQCFWFDKDGLVFNEAPQIEGFLIKKINDYSNRAIKIGDFVLSSDLFSNFLKIFSASEKMGLNAKIFNIENIELQEITLEETIDAPKIYFSLRFDPMNTISAVNSLKQDPGFNKLLYIDLRTENRAFYKLK